jgi:putative holliday junction resolvase
MARLLALDVGAARIGVAVSDASGFLASPYITLRVSRNEEQTWTEIQRLIAEVEAEGVIVGLPVSLDGQIHAQGELIQAFAERLRTHVAVPVSLWDERLSTVEAQRLLAQRNESEGQQRLGRQRGQSKRKRKNQQIDALAATVILQDYLDHSSSKTGEKQR